MIRLGWRLYTVSFILAIAIIADAVLSLSSAQDQDHITNFPERLAIHQGNRLKTVKFDDGHNVICPQLTSLIYAAGEIVEIVFPNFASGFSMPMSRGAGVSHQANAQDFVFLNEGCRYVLTVKKFVVRADTEQEAPLFQPDPKELEKLTPRPLSGPVKPGGPIRADGNKIVIDGDPDRGGFVQSRAVFEAPDSKTRFSGMLYFAPKNMTIFLVNTPKELHLESRKNHPIKSYEIDIKDSYSRIRLSVAKEVYRDDSWIKVFGE